MSYHINSLLKKNKKKYSLQLLTSQAGVSNPVRWVYVAEDIENIDFIKENELIITTGLFTIRGIALFDFISALIDRKTSGIIINTGKYIMEEDITNDVMELCETHNFPLITMPWEISIADVMQDFCGLLLKKKNHKDMLTEALEYVMMGNETTEEYEEILNKHNFFDSSNYGIFSFENSADKRKIKKELSDLCYNFHLMEYENNLLAVIVDPQSSMDEVEMKNFACRAGISLIKEGFCCLPKLYRQAKDALRAALLLEKKIFFYDNIGIMGILFAVKEEELLKEFSKKRLEPLEEHDKKHPLDLINTLFYYLKTDCSPAETSKLLFLHRNTISYRINKIKEISGVSFDTAEERYEYLVAIYIKKMMGMSR